MGQDARLKDALLRAVKTLGYTVVQPSGYDSLLEKVRREPVELVLLEASGEGALPVALEIYSEALAPVVWFTRNWSEELVRQALEARVLGVVEIGEKVDVWAFEFAVGLAGMVFEERKALLKKVEELKEDLETRKLVERAKGVLMDQFGLKDSEAYRRLQRQAMNTRKPLKEVA